MSSIPSRFLDEDFIQEIYVRSLTKAEIAQVLTAWEPFRERIENALDAYEEEEQSWRDYRNSVFDWLPDPLKTPISGPADNSGICPRCAFAWHVNNCTPGACGTPIGVDSMDGQINVGRILPAAVLPPFSGRITVGGVSDRATGPSRIEDIVVVKDTGPPPPSPPDEPTYTAAPGPVEVRGDPRAMAAIASGIATAAAPRWRWDETRAELVDATGAFVIQGRALEFGAEYPMLTFASPYVKEVTELAPELEALVRLMTDNAPAVIGTCERTRPCSCPVHRARAAVARLDAARKAGRDG